MRANLLALIATSVLAARAEGQIIRNPPRVPEPRGWVSLGVGLLQPWRVRDGTTDSQWEFGNAVQYRVSLEAPMQYQTMLGLAVGFARVPLTYVPLQLISTSSCGASCDADATVTQLLATFHAGGGRSTIGLFQVIELGAGATLYSGFRQRATGDRLPPTTVDPDFTIGIGYGFGYTISPEMQVTLVQDFALTLHQRENLTGGDNTLSQQYVTRVGLRMGLGAR